MKYAQNVGYAIPIQVFLDIFRDLKNKKTALQKTNNWGIVPIILADDKAAWLKNPEPSGLYIAKVYKDTVFDTLGIQPGDMLYELDGNYINEYGEMTVSWSQDPLFFPDFLLHLKTGDLISVVLYRKGKKISFKEKVPFCDPFVIQFRFPHYETIAYETIGGIVVMELTLNHVVLFRDDKAEIGPFLFPESWYKPVLIISHVVPGSVLQQTRCVFPGDILSEVNGIFVSTLSEFQTAVEGKKTGFLALKTNQNVLCVQHLHTILEQEETIQKQNIIPASTILKTLR